MIKVKKFTFGPFQENTYVLIGQDKNCWIIDPGCFDESERTELQGFVNSEGLNVARLINTHCHIDHVMGNAFVCETWGLTPEYHRLDEPTMKMAQPSAQMYGIPGFRPSPVATQHIEAGEELVLDGDALEVVFVPGHAPGHIALIDHKGHFVIGGDVLFQGSIGRTDLPGGDHETLLSSIRDQFYTLGDDHVVYSGHGPETTIGEEKKSNPFIRI